MAVRATLCLINAQRRAHHLPALRLTRVLGATATGHSHDMVRRHYFAHGAWYNRILHSGYTASAASWSVGENVGWGTGWYGTPAGMVDMWMHSPEHRANILSRSYRDIGIGIVTGAPVGGRGTTYTTDFGGRRY